MFLRQGSFCLVLPIWESDNVVLHAGASGMTSGLGPCICENKYIYVLVVFIAYFDINY